MKICIFYNTARPQSHKRVALHDFAKSFKQTPIYFVETLNNSTVSKDTNIIAVWAYFKKGKSESKKFYSLNREKYIWFFIDSDPFISYNTPDLYTNYYFRLPINSIYFNESKPLISDNIIAKERWTKIQNAKHITIKPYKPSTPESHILILLQNSDGFGIGKFNMNDWLNKTIEDIRKITQRKIVIRPKPKNPVKYNPTFPNVSMSKNTSLFDDLNGAHAVISINTTAAAVAITEGISSFCDNPQSLVYSVSNHNISDIENPSEFDRTEFLNMCGQYCWSYKELTDGTIANLLLQSLR